MINISSLGKYFKTIFTQNVYQHCDDDDYGLFLADEDCWEG